MLLVGIIILAEYECLQMLVLINDRQLVQLVLPNHIVCLAQRAALITIDQLFKRCHEIRYSCRWIHTGGTIISACDNTEQLSLRCTVFGNRHGRMSCFFLQIQYILQRSIRTDIGITVYKACLCRLYTANHGSLILNRLRTVDEGNASLSSQCTCHLFA